MNLRWKLTILKRKWLITCKTSEKKNETEIQNTMESHSSRLEQVEDRTWELEDKMEIKGKTKELLVK
jgi:hypothetical protein